MAKGSRRTYHPLPFEDLSAEDFERLCLWLLVREEYEDIVFFGARGKDGGRDLEAWKNDQRIIFQCKRVRDFQPAQAKKEIEKIAQDKPDVVHFLLACNPKPSTIDAARKAWGNSRTCLFWGRNQLDLYVRQHGDIVDHFFETARETPIVRQEMQGNAIFSNGNAFLGYPRDTQGTLRIRGSFHICMAQRPQRLVPRHQFREIIDSLCSIRERHHVQVGLWGGGGFGKTVTAKAIAHDDRTKERFSNGVLWVSMGKDFDDTQKRIKIHDLIVELSTGRPSHKSSQGLALHLQEVLKDLEILLVLDDVWNYADAEVFLGLNERSALLLTTRNQAALPANCHAFQIGAMTTNEATRLLGWGVVDDEGLVELEELSGYLGNWPMLLSLANTQLKDSIKDFSDLKLAIAEVEEAIRESITMFDISSEQGRELAVSRTLDYSLQRLSEAEYRQFLSLAIFPEDVEIPLDILSSLWALSYISAKQFCLRLRDQSLLENVDRVNGTIKLHDVTRRYLLEQEEYLLRDYHRSLVRACCPASGEWKEMEDESYFERYLIYHLVSAGDLKGIEELLRDVDFLARRLRKTDLRPLLQQEGQARLDSSEGLSTYAAQHIVNHLISAGQIERLQRLVLRFATPRPGQL